MSTQLSRREFLNSAALCSLATSLAPASIPAGQSGSGMRKFKLCLAPGAVGVKAAPRDVIALAHKHGFEAIEANGAFLSGLSDAELAALRDDMKTKGLVFGAAGMPVDFRQDDARFRTGMEGLPKLAAGLQRAGVTRTRTWITPGSDSLTYLQNFKQHALRLREVAQVLKDHGLHLGLEYVGPPTSRQNRRYHFIHSLREMQELIAEIGTGNVGYVLDSWHWWTAGDTEADLLTLKATDVVSVDFNDAPAGIPLEQQKDNQRELPCATGMIPMGVFVNALQSLGYGGPVRAEPFFKPLNAMAPDEACATVIAALRKAVALLK